MSTQQGKSPPWLPPIEAQVPLLLVRRYWLLLMLEFGLTALVAAAILAGAGFAGLLRPQIVLVALAVVGSCAALLAAAILAGAGFAGLLRPQTVLAALAAVGLGAALRCATGACTHPS